MLSMPATVVLEIIQNGDVADSFNKTNIIILYWFVKTYVHCILDYIHCTLELNIAIYLLLKLVWVRVEVTAPFLILLLKNAKYCYDEIRNSLCLALKEGFSVMTE